MAEMKKMNESKFTYSKILREVFPVQNISKVLILIKQIREEMKVDQKEDTNEALLTILEKVSDELGIDLPFEDTNKMDDIYNLVREYGEFSWTDIITFYSEENKNNEIKVPYFLFDDMLGKKSSVNNILIAEAEKFSESLVDVINSNQNWKFTLVTDDPIFFQLLNIGFANNSNIKVNRGSIYKFDFLQEKFDFILAMPKLESKGKDTEDLKFISRDFALIALENLSSYLENDGVLSIVLPQRINSSGPKVSEVRRYIESKFNLVEIAELPSGIFSTTAINTYLLTITTAPVQEVSIKKIQLAEESGEYILREIQSMLIPSDELIEAGSWNLDRIFRLKDKEWLKFIESELKKERLGNVSTIFRGKSIGKKLSEGNIRVINISDLGNYEVDYSELAFINEEERKVASYLLKTGDLLITARGTALRIALFEEQSYPIIASSNIIVIRPNDRDLSSTFLKLFLDSPLGRKALLLTQQGGQLMNLNYKDVAEILIPLPEIEEQVRIDEEYRQEYNLYKSTLLEANERWNNVIEKLRDIF